MYYSALHLGVPSTSPATSSPSPNSVHIKSEPNSPPRPDHHPLAHMLSHTTHTSLSGQHLVPGILDKYENQPDIYSVQCRQPRFFAGVAL